MLKRGRVFSTEECANLHRKGIRVLTDSEGKLIGFENEKLVAQETSEGTGSKQGRTR